MGQGRYLIRPVVWCAGWFKPLEHASNTVWKDAGVCSSQTVHLQSYFRPPGVSSFMYACVRVRLRVRLRVHVRLRVR